MYIRVFLVSQTNSLTLSLSLSLSKTHTHRSLFLPYKLTPHLINFTNFERGSSNFSATIQLATGHKNTKRAKHSTIKDAIRNLASRGDNMSCVVLYSNAWYKPWSRLCVKMIALTDIKRQLNAN